MAAECSSSVLAGATVRAAVGATLVLAVAIPARLGQRVAAGAAGLGAPWLPPASAPLRWRAEPPTPLGVSPLQPALEQASSPQRTSPPAASAGTATLGSVETSGGSGGRSWRFP